MVKKVLIISYYWPPSGGAGVQRWLKFVKFLPENGWHPIIYVPQNPHYPVLDESLLKDVPRDVEIIRYPIWEPYTFYKRFVGMSRDEKVQHGFIRAKKDSPFKERISLWIRSNFFIPDARTFWIRPSVKYLQRYFSTSAKPDLIISTGPPHSMHMIASGLKKTLNVPWIADFRDPWTGIDYYPQLLLTKWADNKHHRLEREVLAGADRVISVGWHMKHELLSKGATAVEVITNGFDSDDFTFHGSTPHDKQDKFTLLHLGAINKDRNSTNLWKAISQLTKTDGEFKNKLQIQIIGSTDHQVLETIEKYGLDPWLEKIDYVPHVAVPELLKSASVLVLLLNNAQNIEGIITGKLFEYLAAHRRILCIGSSTGDAARIIDSAKAGSSFGFDELEGIRNFIQDEFNAYQKDISQKPDHSAILQYSRKALTSKLVQLMDEVCP